MNFRSWLSLGLIATASFPLISFGAESTTSAPRVYNQVEIAYIQGLNCDTFTADAKWRCLEIKKQVAIQSPVTGTGPVLPPPPPAKTESGSDDRRPPMTPATSQTGSDNHHPMPMVWQSGTLMPMPKPPMGSGTTENPGKGLMLAIGQLSTTDREALMKTIREYLASKGIDMAKYVEQREEIKEVKKETRTEIKEIRNTTQDAARMKREEMRKKVIEIRNGTGANR